MSGFGPILLKKSGNAVGQNFSASWKHFPSKDAARHIGQASATSGSLRDYMELRGRQKSNVDVALN